METKSQKDKSGVNFYVVAILFVLMVLYMVGNTIEPDIDSQLDVFEAALLAGYVAAAVSAFNVARRYWGSQIFGKAYLALGIGYASYFTGWLLWFIYEIVFQVENPYPYYPDIAYFGFFPFAIYHLRTNIHYFKRKLDKKQKITLFMIPAGTVLVYLFIGLVPIDTSSGIFALKVLPTENYNFDYWDGLLTGAGYIFVTTFVFSYVMVGVQIFRGTILGAAWGLLLVAFALNAMGDVPYYFFELVGIYERAHPITGMWMGSTILASYALYKHREL